MLMAASATLASASYTVRKGDTLSEIAEKLHVSTTALSEANDVGKKHPLKIGMKLIVPKTKAEAKASKGGKTAKATKKAIHTAAGGDTYTVREGQNDWTIANQAGLKLSLLHRLNPGVNWDALRPGAKLHLPKGMGVAATTPRIRSRVAVITKDGATIRRKPGVGAEAVTTVDAGTRVAVLARDGGWYMLRFPKGTTGWVRGDLLKAAKPAPAPVAHHEERVVRRSHKSEHVERVAYVATMHRSKKRAPHKTTYVRRWSHQQRKYVVAPLTNGGDLIARAETFKGVRYSWGSASRSGTDCSGFTTQVFRGEGVQLPRTSREQSTVGNGVAKDKLAKGDLVFFHTGRGMRVTHVGIYMGEGKFIHASSGGGKVQVNNLSEGYYANRFLTGRRVPKKTAK